MTAPTAFDPLADAVVAFLEALGQSPSKEPELAQTPRLVAKAWREELLSGYASSPEAILAEQMPAPAGAPMVSLTQLDFQGVCPHHLLPFAGTAAIAYVPSRSIVGFGQIVRLLDCLSRRLVLQETLARQLVDTLTQSLGARGVAVMLTATQGCLSLRGARRCGARVSVEALSGVFETDAALKARWLETLRDRP